MRETSVWCAFSARGFSKFSSVGASPRSARSSSRRLLTEPSNARNFHTTFRFGTVQSGFKIARPQPLAKMFKILSEAVAKNLEVAGKQLAKGRPYSSKGKDAGLTDFSKKKDCVQKACEDRSTKMPPSEPPSSCEKAASPKTWRTCPEPPKPKEFSCDDTLQQKVPRRIKRPVASRPACSKPAPSLEAPECVKVKKELCPRAAMPGCSKAKIPPRCEPKKVVRNCIKVKPPVASFSECYKNPFPPQPRSECNCLSSPKIC